MKHYYNKVLYIDSQFFCLFGFIYTYDVKKAEQKIILRLNIIFFSHFFFFFTRDYQVFSSRAYQDQDDFFLLCSS